MPKFREKQPIVEVDAVQWRGYNRDEVCAWLDACPNVRYRFDEEGELILTWNYNIKRDQDVSIGCWIYDDADDRSVYIETNDAFVAKYEPVELLTLRVSGDLTSERVAKFKADMEQQAAGALNAWKTLIIDTGSVRGAEIVDQPPPVDRPGSEPVWDMVVIDMQRRYLEPFRRFIVAEHVIGDMREHDRVGRERYGKPLTADNGRDQLIDAYQEILDASVYTRAAMAEGTLVPEAVYNNLLDSLVIIRRLIDRRAKMVALVGGAE